MQDIQKYQQTKGRQATVTRHCCMPDSFGMQYKEIRIKNELMSRAGINGKDLINCSVSKA